MINTHAVLFARDVYVQFYIQKDRQEHNQIDFWEGWSLSKGFFIRALVRNYTLTNLTNTFQIEHQTKQN